MSLSGVCVVLCAVQNETDSGGVYTPLDHHITYNNIIIPSALI
jgi:hypothetical protein